MPIPGHVYILVNPRVYELVKIGRTNDLDRRLDELNAHAGIAGRWTVAGYVTVSDMEALERNVHRCLRDVRDSESGGTEMFECSPDEAGVAILNVLTGSNIKLYDDRLPATVRWELQKQKAARDEARLEAEAKERDRLGRIADDRNRVSADQLANDLNIVAENKTRCQNYIFNVEKHGLNHDDKIKNLMIVCFLFSFLFFSFITFHLNTKTQIVVHLIFFVHYFTYGFFKWVYYGFISPKSRFFDIPVLDNLHQRVGVDGLRDLLRQIDSTKSDE